MALWGDWDEALHHYRRYNRSQLCGLFAADHWDVLHVNYTNVIVYPIVWLVRKWRRLRAGKPGKKRNRILRSEDRIPSPWLNRVLHRTFVRLGSSRIPFPFGVSLVLVARRRA
jgi:hypothetical protein